MGGLAKKGNVRGLPKVRVFSKGDFFDRITPFHFVPHHTVGIYSFIEKKKQRKTVNLTLAERAPLTVRHGR